MKLNADYVVYLDAEQAKVTVEDKAAHAEKHPQSHERFNVSTMADLLSTFVQAVIDCGASARCVHEAFLTIPEYRAAVPLDSAGRVYSGQAYEKGN